MFQTDGALEQIFTQSPLAMWIQDRHNHGILEANQPALALFGMNEDDVLGRCWTDFMDGTAALDPRPGGRIHHVGKDGRSLDLRLSAHDVACDPPAVLVIAHEFPIDHGKESPLPAESAPRISERRYRKLFERSLAGMFKTTPNGAFLDCNEALARMLGYDSREELLGVDASQLYFDAAERQFMVAELHRHGVLNNYEARFRRKDGSVLWGIENITLLVEEGPEAEIIAGTLVDIGARKRLEDLNLGQQRLLEMVAQGLPLRDILKALVELVAQQVPGASCAVLGSSQEGFEVLASAHMPEPFLAGIADPGTLAVEVIACLTEFLTHRDLQIHNLSHDPAMAPLRDLLPGLQCCWTVSIHSGLDVPLGLFLLLGREFASPHPEEVDLLEMARRMAVLALEHELLTERLAHKSQHDDLTGLPNRLLFSDRLAQAVAQAARRQQPVAVFSLDLDGFKDINDSMGHQVGDILLQDVARRLMGALRQTDTLARMEGDEFMMLLPDLKDPKDAVTVAQKCTDALLLPFQYGDYAFFITASMGISLFPEDSEDPAALMRFADAALHRAKSQGRDRLQFYTPEMNDRALERLDLENHLRKIVHELGFVLHYQPQFRADGRLLGFEALLRWPDSIHGSVPPSKFIPLAEETGLIHPLGAWVLEEACRQTMAWHHEGYTGLRMAVNVSLLQFERAGFLESVGKVLASSGLHPATLELELTESLVMKDPRGAASRLTALREMGVQVAIDDFGTGYSSLSYLHSLPIDTLKIDQSFVRDIAVDAGGGSNPIIETIVALGHNLGMVLVAEGVETAEQLAYLQRLGCDAIQGFLLGKPLPADQCRALLKRSFPKDEN